MDTPMTAAFEKKRFTGNGLECKELRRILLRVLDSADMSVHSVAHRIY